MTEKELVLKTLAGKIVELRFLNPGSTFRFVKLDNQSTQFDLMVLRNFMGAVAICYTQDDGWATPLAYNKHALIEKCND